jgi:hypothetical protein
MHFLTMRPKSRRHHAGDQRNIQRQGGAPVRGDDRGLGHRGHARRRDHRRPALLADPGRGHPLAGLRAVASVAHQRGDLRVRRLRAVRDQPARGPAHLPRAGDLGQAGRVRVLGLAGGHRVRCGDPAAGLHPGQGVRRAGMADRHPDRGGLGRLRGAVPRHDRQAQGQAHLRGQLVLRVVHHRGGPAAHRQQHRDAGRRHEVVLRLQRRRGCDGAVVVWPQRGRLLPDRRLPRDDVLLRAQAGRAPDLFLSPVDRPLLGADRGLHVGRPAPSALHRAAGLGAIGWHGVLADPAGAQLGRRDQRHHDPVRRLA